MLRLLRCCGARCHLHSFPTRRSSDLVATCLLLAFGAGGASGSGGLLIWPLFGTTNQGPNQQTADRKSTRLNSSHVAISYAVFRLQKKKHTLLATAFPPDASARPGLGA